MEEQGQNIKTLKHSASGMTAHTKSFTHLGNAGTQGRHKLWGKN